MPMYEEEMQAKIVAQKEWEARNMDAGIAGNPCGKAVQSDMISGRPSLRDQVSRQLSDALYRASKRERLMELDYLLSKHPDVARILDLMEYVRR